MPYCQNCGRDLPAGALFCPDCGARAPALLDYTLAQSNISPSHLNSGITATSQPQTTVTGEEPATAPPPPSPYEGAEKKPPRFGGGKGIVLVIAALAIVLLGISIEAGMLGSGAAAGPAVNSANTPLTGKQLYSAYASNASQADSSYTNKLVYIEDSLDFGVGMDNSGHYFSSVNSGNVVLVWRNQAQVGQLSPGAMVLAKCSVAGMQPSLGGAYLLYLHNCDLLSIQSQTSTTATMSISVANL